MKAAELKEDMFPQMEVVQAYDKAGQTCEPSVHDRVWTTFFYPLVTADPIKDQKIRTVISHVQRTHQQAKNIYSITWICTAMIGKAIEKIFHMWEE
jgi:hypothetical protein